MSYGAKRATIGSMATPATTVNVAIRNIVQPLPDLVVSGINRGYNLGYSAYLSGTVGAAREAAMHGVPAIAASVQEEDANRNYGNAAEEVLGVARRVKQYGLPKYTFLNVNVPAMPAGGYRGYRITTQALQHGGEERFVETPHPSGRTVYWNVYKEGATAPEGTDIHAVSEGYVSVTPLTIDLTNHAALDGLRNWFGA